MATAVWSVILQPKFPVVAKILEFIAVSLLIMFWGNLLKNGEWFE